MNEQDNEFVPVKRSVLFGLIYADMTLDALNAAGVDNWEGYDFAEIPDEDVVKDAVVKMSGFSLPEGEEK